MSFILRSELRSTATSPSKPILNDHKRHGSPSLVDDEDKPIKKRLILTTELHQEGETAFSSEKNTDNKQSARYVKPDIPLSIGSGEVKAISIFCMYVLQH